MPEWSNGPHSKCGERVTVPGVRIPLSPRQEKILPRVVILSQPFYIEIASANSFAAPKLQCKGTVAPPRLVKSSLANQGVQGWALSGADLSAQ